MPDGRTHSLPPEPIRCAAWCSQWPNCQHDWREWHRVIAERKEAKRA